MVRSPLQGVERHLFNEIIPYEAFEYLRLNKTAVERINAYHVKANAKKGETIILIMPCHPPEKHLNQSSGS